MNVLPHPSPGVLLKELEDGAVLYCARTEVYFGVNAVGVAIWNQLPPTSSSMEEIVAAIRDRFPEADPEEVRADAVEFLDELARAGLVLAPSSAESTG